MSSPTADDRDDVLLSCRYGDLEDVQQFVERFGAPALADVHDENENTVLHMVCANGHTSLLEYLLPIVPATLLSAHNASGSTPLHWAALTSQLAAARALVEFPGGPGIDLIDIKNTAGRSPLGEAEVVGWEEGAKWMVEVMRLDETGKPEDDVHAVGDIEVEIEDADGQVARMSLGPAKEPPPPAS